MLKVGTDFSGIGSVEVSLKTLNIDHEIEFACDKDKYARQTYLANHTPKILYEDIVCRDNNNTPYVDLYFFSPPCQSFSLAGKRKGFDDIRGTMFFHSADYIRKQRPRVFIMENVKGLLSHDKPKGSKGEHGTTFTTMINLLAETINGQTLMMPYEDNLGYHIFYKVLNSKYYDVPQNRERVFIVGFRDLEDTSFRFPNSKIVSKRLSDILEPVVDEKYYLSEKMLNWFASHNKKNAEKGNGFKFAPVDIKGVGKCINQRVFKMGVDDNYIMDHRGTRRLTVTEAGKMQGFNDGFLIPVSDTQGYRQFGNSITTNVIVAILKNIKHLNA